jgi:hypothetical protein
MTAVRYLKSTVVGFVTAVVASFGWVLLRLFVAESMARQVAEGRRGGIGAVRVGFVIDYTDVSILGPALVGFLIGFWWMFRRGSRPTGPVVT